MYLCGAMTLGDAQKKLSDQLKKSYPAGESVKITDMVIEKLTGLTPTQRMIHKQDILTPVQESQWEEICIALLKSVPVQQVLEEAWFYGMPFYVNPAVLVPRPETEELIHYALEKVKGEKNKRILDIGTGSGCIPIALKKQRPDLEVWAIEKYPEALKVAQKNARKLKTDIHFLRQDIFNKEELNSLPDFDIILSNPPYIPVMEKKNMEKHVVDHEPETALFVPDDNALIFYKKILEMATTHLKQGGSAMVEINETLGAETKALFEAQLTHVVLKKDFDGKDRILWGQKL